MQEITCQFPLSNMQQRPGTRDVGIEYQFKVITYVAASLSQKENVRNFVIHSNLDNIPGFDDLIIKVWFEQEQHPHVYLGQVKHRSSKINFDGEKHKLAHYKEYIETIFRAREQIECMKDVPADNIEFWYFTNNFISGKISLEKKSSNSAPCLYNVKPLPTYKSILPSEKNAICHRLTTKDPSEDEKLFDKFYFFLNQPNNWQIEDKIKVLCYDGFTRKMTEEIVKYVDKYFNRFKADGLMKNIFDTEVLRIHLSKFIVKPTKIIEIVTSQARIWNKLTLRHNITIVEDVKDIERHLFGCFLRKINDVYDCNFKWDDCMSDGGKLGVNFDIQKFVDFSKSKQVRHWLITPETIELLLIEMWKSGDLPLILKPTNGISILKKYKHLKKRFIIIGDVIAKFNEANVFCAEIFTNAANIKSAALKNELLNGLMVSLQGRTPVRLYDVVSGNTRIMKEITCSQILHVIKKRTTYLQENCLTETDLSIYLIINDVKEDATDLDKIEIHNSDNIVINCKTQTTLNSYHNRISYLEKYKNYSIYHLLLRENKLEILRGDRYKIRNYLVDQDGNHVYGMGKYDGIPIIGKRLGHKEQVYIQRSLHVPILNVEILDIQEQRVCFLCGYVQCLDPYIKKEITTEFSESHIKNNLEIGKNALFYIDADTVEEQWLKLCSSPVKYQLLHLNLNMYGMQLLKYVNCPNINSYLTRSGGRVPENKFFETVLKFTKATLIIGETGMGKSLLLQSLSEICSKKDFVVLCNLAQCREDLQNDNRELLESPLEFFCKKVETSQVSTNILNQVFNFHKTNGRLVLFLDSFDEVAQFYGDKVLSLIENILKHNIKLIIASKTMNANMLCDRFQINSICISALNQEDVRQYTTRKNSSDIDLNNIPFGMVKNPLYLNLLCQLHQQGSLKISADTFDLYRQIWDMKIKRYYNKNKLDYAFKLVEDNLLRNHQLMALIAVFGKNIVLSKMIIKDYDDFMEKFKNFDINLGFINLIDGNTPIFVHQVIAIALALEWVYENIPTDVAAQDIYRMIVQGNEFADIRPLFDSLSCKGINLHQAVIEEDVDLIEKLCTKPHLTKTDKCGRNALHLAVSHCKGYSNETNFKIVEIIIKGMLDNKCDLNQKDTFLKWRWVDYANFYNKMFFYFACVHGSTATVDLYLKERRDNDLSILKRWRGNVDSGIFSQIKFVLQEVLMKDHADICRMLLKKITSVSSKDIFDSTAIHLATKAGHLDIVTILLKKGANINGMDSAGNTPLHYAVMHERKPIVKYLLKMGANANAMNKKGNTPLHEAAIISDTDLMKILIKNKASINARNNQGCTILHFVSRGDDVDVVRWVIGLGCNIQEQSLAGLSPLHLACVYNNKCNATVAKELIRRGANIESVDIHGRTPLHRAAEVGLVEIVTILLENKADVKVKDIYGQTAFHLACTRSNDEVVKLLLNHGVKISEKNEDGETALHIAAHHKKISVSKILIEKGINLTAADNFGYTALHMASERGTIETVQLLLNAKVDSTRVDIFGNTPLHLASLNGDVTIAELIVASNKNILLIRNNYGKTPFHIACEEGHYDLVKYFIKNGAEVLTLDNYGKTALHLASEYGRLEILEMLLDNSNQTDLDIRDNFGRTLLHLSSLRGRFEVTEFLLDIGLSPNLLDQRNSTPMHLACSSGHLNIVELLLGKNADLMLIDVDMKTPLHSASEEGHTNIVGALFPKYTNHVILDSLGRTCLHLAAERGYKDVAKILVQNEIFVLVRSLDQETPLHIAAKHGHADIVRLLLTANAQVTNKDRFGYTPFHNAVCKGHLEIVKIFLKRGVVVDEFNDAGDTALHIAIKEGHLSIIKLLLRSGASIELKDGNGNTPLHLGVLQNSFEIVDVLLLHEADANVINNDEETAVDVAKRLKYSNICRRMKPIKKRKQLFSRLQNLLN